MTFILNVLHKDMSVLAADRKAIAELRATTTSDMTTPVGDASIVHNYKKITLNSNGSLALGIAGLTHEHYYTSTIEQSASIDDGLLIIRKHMERFMRIHDRSSLRTLNEFTVNQGIASFFDRNADMYFANTFLFSPVENQTRLYRGTDEAKIFYAGSGSRYFEKAVGLAAIDSFITSTKNSFTLEACISWMRNAYGRVSVNDASCGAEAVFVVSSRSDPTFRFIEDC